MLVIWSQLTPCRHRRAWTQCPSDYQPSMRAAPDASKLDASAQAHRGLNKYGIGAESRPLVERVSSSRRPHPRSPCWCCSPYVRRRPWPALAPCSTGSAVNCTLMVVSIVHPDHEQSIVASREEQSQHGAGRDRLVWIAAAQLESAQCGGRPAAWAHGAARHSCSRPVNAACGLRRGEQSRCGASVANGQVRSEQSRGT